MERNGWQKKEIARERPRVGFTLAWRFIPFPRMHLSRLELLISALPTLVGVCFLGKSKRHAKEC